jgi:hypothetical protein
MTATIMLLSLALVELPNPSNIIMTGTVLNTDNPFWSLRPESDAPLAGDPIYGEIACQPWDHCEGWITMGRLHSIVYASSLTEIWGMPDRAFLNAEYGRDLTRWTIPWDGNVWPTAEERATIGGIWFTDQHIQITPLTLEPHPVGDSSLDGRFNSRDIITAFRAGEYEDGVFRNSTFVEGDWNADQEFDSRDFISVFRIITYEAPVMPVPEPSSWSLLALGLLCCAKRTARRTW